MKIYKLNNGDYVSALPLPGSGTVDEEIEIDDCQSIMLGDYGHCDQCLVVRKGDKLGMMFLWGDYPITYGTRAWPFIYDKLQIYTSERYVGESAYAVAGKGGKCFVMEITDGSEKNILSSKEVDGNPIYEIPEKFLNGPSFSPLQHTPEMITSLKPNEIFVFGSNKEGLHGGGAAYAANKYFGAQMGVGVGRTGQCYAIPTMDHSLDLIAEYVEGFRCYAKCHKELQFLVTPIGCGIARWTKEQIAPLFGFAREMANVTLPAGWDRL